MIRSVFAAAVLAASVSAAASAADGIAPVDAVQCAAMKARHVLNEGAPVGCDRLAVVSFHYVDFSGRERSDGRIVVLDAVAPRVERIFAMLFERRFALAKALPMEAYDGNDHAAMADDNTSAFNDRPVPGTSRISLHAYGAAIDLNPVENPFVTRSGSAVTVDPPQGVAFLNRLAHRPGKTDRPGMAEAVIDVFGANGFSVWGGYWDDPLDYQHFDIGRSMAERLASLPPDKARAAFEDAIAAAKPR